MWIYSDKYSVSILFILKKKKKNLPCFPKWLLCRLFKLQNSTDSKILKSPKKSIFHFSSPKSAQHSQQFVHKMWIVFFYLTSYPDNLFLKLSTWNSLHFRNNIKFHWTWLFRILNKNIKMIKDLLIAFSLISCMNLDMEHKFKKNWSHFYSWIFFYFLKLNCINILDLIFDIWQYFFFHS